jgi:3-isopropylmalate/(R)-2-methylmalate dehydratase large subunit
MGLTITQKILSAHCGGGEIEPGAFIMAEVDFLLANDITAPLAIKEFEAFGAQKVFDTSKIALVLDHFTPARDIESAQQAKLVRDFARKHNIRYLFQEGKGIEHALLPEAGLTLPGELIIGADSHTCTYGAVGAFSTGVGSTDAAFAMIEGKVWLKIPESIKFIYHGELKPWVSGKDLILYTIGDIGVNGADYCAMELCGEVIEKLPMDSRFTMANMAIEAGAKNCVIEPDTVTAGYMKEVPAVEGRYGLNYKSDVDAVYKQVIEYDAAEIYPQVALPSSPANVKPVSELSPINIDQVVIGSCTNGRIGDLRTAAEILKGNKVHEYVRLIIIPGTEKIYLRALKEGLIGTFVEAGGIISPPTCGPCLGGHMGILAKGERALATTNRNFVGRMGHPESEVYLCNPAVAAASAIKGKITHPEEIRRGSSLAL